MKNQGSLFRLLNKDWLLVAISVIVLLACLLYTVAHIYMAPYPGISLNAGDAEWVVTQIDPCNAHPGWCETNQDLLRVGDNVISIGDLSFDNYAEYRGNIRFDGYDPGDSVSITVVRDGKSQTIQWVMPIVTVENRLERLVGLLFYLPFWLAGTVVMLFLRPRNACWLLLPLFYYLSAFWLATGMVSGSQVAASSTIMHAAIWLIVPVYLHLHILVPAPLFKNIPRYLMPILYIPAAILAILESFQLLPHNLDFLGFFLAIAISLGILIFRYFDKTHLAVQLTSRWLST